MIYLKEGRTPLNFAYSDEIVHDGNSTYQLSFKFPTNNPLWEELVEETLLLADDLHGEQEFIIFEVEKHHAYITVHANQVATLLNNYSIMELSVNNASGDRVMRSLVSSIIREHKFTFSSDIASTHSINLKNVTVATALFKDKHSILGQWGGDLIRDKYDIRLLSNGGTNKEALFMYKKNLKSYQQKKSIKDLRTRIHFTKTISSQKEGEKNKVIAVTVDSPLISKYKNIYEGNLDVSDQDVIDEVTLRKYGEQYFKTTLCDVIEESIEIDVVGNPDVPVNIFDTVTVFHEKFNLDVKKKITKYTYTPMGRKLKTIGFGKIQQGLGTTLASMIDDAVTEHVESKVDAFKIQKNLSELLKLDRKSIEDKLVDLEEKSNSALEVKKALFEADGNIPDVVKTKILDAVEAEVGRLKTIITEAELIKAIQAKLDYAEIKNALIDKAFINQIISDERFTQQFKDGEVTTQNIFTKLKDSIKSNISKDFVTKEGVKKLVNDLTIDADGIRQITQQEITNRREELKGKSSYMHTRYSDNSNGSNFDTNSNRKYIGIYTGDKEQAPTNASEYSWTKIHGEDGRQGVPGVRGADGRTSYLHTAYANSSTGDVDFSTTNSNGKEYIGTYSDFEINDSNDYRRYKWMKIKGENGRDGNNGRDGKDGNVELNLLNGTKEFLKSQFAPPDSWQRASVWVDETERYEEFAVKSTIYESNGLWQNVKVEKGKTYEFGFFAKGSRDTDRILFSPGWPSSSAKQPLAQYNVGDVPFKLTTAWKFYSFRFTVTETGWSQCRVEKNENNNGIKFSLCGLYLKELKNDQSAPLGWSPSIEDLQGHTLTANLWFSGNYINNVTSNVRLNLVVYYDGKEIRDFNVNIRYFGGGVNDWRTQENVRVLRDNTVDYGFWGNGEKNGEPLFALAIVNYKGLEIVSTARLDNVPNVEDVKETVKQLKTFQSTLDNFKSVIGEIKGKEIKTIVNTPNLCNEDFSKEKSGNDLYFTVSSPLKANTKYTIIVDVNLKKEDVHQKTKVYGAKSGGGEQWLKSGRNVWVVDYATEQTRVNIYPLGEFSKVFNVEIYEGDYREFIEQNNRFVSMGLPNNEHSRFYSYNIKHNVNINNAKGKYFLVKFDLASLPADKWFSCGDTGTVALYLFREKQLTEELKLKDNEYIFKANADDNFSILHSTNSLKLINVRLYEVRFGVALATQSSLIDISSMIDHSKEAVTLSAKKEIESRLTNYPSRDYLDRNFANKQNLENLVSKSELKVLSDRIESSVNTGNFGTTLSQNAYYVKVAWNGISNYVQFEDGGLNFYEGSNTQNNLRARIDDGNYTFWRDGYNLGNMGTGYYKFDPQKKGIQFHLEYDGWFMGWAYKQKRTDNFYTWKWYYTSGSVGDTYGDTLNAGCHTNFRWNEIWYFKTKTSWFNITDGLNGTISVVSNIENTGDGGIRWWTRNLTFKNGILIGG